MVSKEGDIRMIGYGAMLIEGLVGVVALLAAASLPPGDYWAINIDLNKVEKYASQLEKLNATSDNLPEIERQIGGESLRGRTGGAVTLAVGMSRVLTNAMDRLSGGRISIDAVIKYWYHFAIMFEALFILTTIDTGTRIARFLFQEALGKIYAPFDRTDWMPGAVLCTGLVTLGWGGLIWTGSIDTIWPMFGIANQMLAVIGLAVVTTAMINAGRGRYAWITILPMSFVTVTTTTAAYQLVTGPFYAMLQTGLKLKDSAAALKGALNMTFVTLIVAAVAVIVIEAIFRWCGVPSRTAGRSRQSVP
jgi:carbon starvation protein